MKKEIKIIDLLCLISNGEKVPNKIKYKGIIYTWENYGTAGIGYMNIENGMNWLCKQIDFENRIDLNNEVTILDIEYLNNNLGEALLKPFYDEDKDIPLIPDDELYEISNQCTKDIYGFHKSGCDKDTGINYNFKVLKEKINQVVKEFNEYRKENE